MSGLSSLTAQAVELLVERVEEQFDEGVDNLSRAITNITVPHIIGEDQYSENNIDFGFEHFDVVSVSIVEVTAQSDSRGGQSDSRSH